MSDFNDSVRPQLTTMDLDLGNGVIVAAEVFIDATHPTDDEGEGRSDAGMLDTIRQSREAVLAATSPPISAMAQWVHAQVSQLVRAPDRIGVDLGVKFVVKSPTVVVPVLGQVGAETTLLVRLEWDMGPSATGGLSPTAQGDDNDDEVSPSEKVD